MSRRVIHVVRSDSFAGVERYIADAATELSRRGWAVTVIGGEPARMRAELPSAVSLAPATTTADVARALWHADAADVVHAHMTAAELPAAALKHRLGGQLVVTRHFARARGSSAPTRLAGRFVQRRVDHQIAISEFVAHAIGEPSTVIWNGVRRSQIVGAERSPSVVMMQRLEPEKSTAVGLRAFAQSGLAERGWRLDVYGAGREHDALVRLAHELGIAEVTTLHGRITGAREALASASILLAPAAAEPFGLTVVEAMAEGTPVLASRAGAHPETLGDGGHYFPAGDQAAAARGLLALADDTDGRTLYGRALQERHAALFDLSQHVDRLEQIYAPR